MIIVLGATGFTGKLIAAELKKFSANFIIAGRNESTVQALSASLGGVPTRIIDTTKSETLSNLEGCSVVINCAGPYTELGEPVVQAACDRGLHYLDLTGEQSFIKLVYDKYDGAAKKVGVALVPACAFEYSLGDAMGSIICERDQQCRRLDIVYSVNGAHTSAGTRKSVIHAMNSAGYQLVNGQLQKISASTAVQKPRGFNNHAIVFPGGEVLMLPKHTPLTNVSTFMAATANPVLLNAMVHLSPPVLKLAGGLLLNLAGQGGFPTEAQRKSTTFRITASSTDAHVKGLTVSGADPYWLTAVIASAVAIHLSEGKCEVVGAVSPAMAAGPGKLRELLTDVGVKWIDD